MEMGYSEEVIRLYEKLKRDAEAAGYHLHPNEKVVLDIVGGLVKNTERYGYPSCPCRLASGEYEKDVDIICPCDYRDADLLEYGACLCNLYVSDELIEQGKEYVRVPERRGKEKKRKEMEVSGMEIAYPVWRCKVCGYLCARDAPPSVCPICKARDRWERLI